MVYKEMIVLLVILLVLLFFDIRYLLGIHRQNTLREIALDTIQAFNDNKVDYWVDYGTLLGIVREGDIIRHDTDVDICVVDSPDMHIKLRNAMKDIHKKDKGYVFTYHPWGAYRISKGLPISYFADIYLTNKIEDRYVDPTGSLPIDLLGSRQYIEWKGISIRVPEDIHGTLKWRYGDDYMIPRKGMTNIN